MTLLLYNRYVSDVLSSLKGYDAKLLRSLDLESNGIDLETEIVSKLPAAASICSRCPSNISLARAQQGKKIRTGDGLKALFALFRFRLKRD